MLALGERRIHPLKKQGETVSKTFAFRCEWTEFDHGIEKPDGFTYATSREDLMDAIHFIERQGDPRCYSRHSNIQVVMIGGELFSAIRAARNRCFTTVEHKHPLDFEREHSLQKSK
jgi:hypothetical protein